MLLTCFSLGLNRNVGLFIGYTTLIRHLTAMKIHTIKQEGPANARVSARQQRRLVNGNTIAAAAEMTFFSYPSRIRRPRSLSCHWNFTVPFHVRKLESWGYTVVKIAWSYLEPSLTDPPVWRTDGQTDGETDGRPDGRAMAYSVL